jgi:hypothetical protein
MGWDVGMNRMLEELYGVKVLISYYNTGDKEKFAKTAALTKSDDACGKIIDEYLKKHDLLKYALK